jgi:hypothetical protein
VKNSDHQKKTTTAEDGMYQVKVWFATSSAPQVVARFSREDEAMREARAYLSDARGVWVIQPDGNELRIDEGWR